MYNVILGGVILFVVMYISLTASYLLPLASEEFRVLWISIGVLISTIIVCTMNLVKKLNKLLQEKENKPHEIKVEQNQKN